MVILLTIQDNRAEMISQDVSDDSKFTGTGTTVGKALQLNKGETMNTRCLRRQILLLIKDQGHGDEEEVIGEEEEVTCCYWLS